MLFDGFNADAQLNPDRLVGGTFIDQLNNFALPFRQAIQIRSIVRQNWRQSLLEAFGVVKLAESFFHGLDQFASIKRLIQNRDRSTFHGRHSQTCARKRGYQNHSKVTWASGQVALDLNTLDLIHDLIGHDNARWQFGRLFYKLSGKLIRTHVVSGLLKHQLTNVQYRFVIVNDINAFGNDWRS